MDATNKPKQFYAHTKKQPSIEDIKYDERLKTVASFKKMLLDCMTYGPLTKRDILEISERIIGGES